MLSSRIGTGRQGVAFFVLCLELGRVIPNADVELAFRTIDGTGGHDHDTNGVTRPQGTLEPRVGNTGEDGFQFRTVFESPEASGVTVVTGICTAPDRIQTPFRVSIGVRVNGLVRLPESSAYGLVGSTTRHTGNHFGTPALNQSIATLAQR